MACFLVPLVQAAGTTAIQKIIEKKKGKDYIWSKRLGTLNTLLWGGIIMLIIDHIWNGEIKLFPPFFSFLENPQIAFHEITTLGITMSIVITLIWVGMILFEYLSRGYSKTTKLQKHHG